MPLLTSAHAHYPQCPTEAEVARHPAAAAAAAAAAVELPGKSNVRRLMLSVSAFLRRDQPSKLLDQDPHLEASAFFLT